MFPFTFSKLHKQLARYFSAALLGYIFDFGTLVMLTKFFHVYYLISASIGFTVGLLITFVLSKKYVFGSSKVESKSYEFGIFAVVGLVGLGLLNLLMWILSSKLGTNYVIAKILATVVVYGWNFFARRSFYNDDTL
jgi:putative flippase GtrA